MKVHIQCLNCGVDHTVEQKEINRGYGKFCSLTCSSRYSAKNKSAPQPNVRCAWCSKSFYRSPSKIKRTKNNLHFCSVNCHNKAARLNGGLPEIWPEHYGTGNDYRKIAFDNLSHKCNRCEYDKHIKILEVHHIDEDRTNNMLSNLEILCPNCHTVEHLVT